MPVRRLIQRARAWLPIAALLGLGLMWARNRGADAAPAASERAGADLPPTRESTIRDHLRERLSEQTYSHWTEMAVIIASADAVLALGLFGTCVTVGLPARIVALGLAVAATSTVAVVLAYYSIRVGPTFSLGPLNLGEVLSSFLIAGAQIGLFLLPLHVLRSHATPVGMTDQMRWWLLVHASFCVSAVVPIISQRAARRRDDVGAIIPNGFESAQSFDRFGALGNGLFSSAAFLWSMLQAEYAYDITFASASLSFLMMSIGVFSQASQSRLIRTYLSETAR